jgi:hypothetical protein
VYTSLRQEAWPGLDDDDREAIKGSAMVEKAKGPNSFL